MSCGTVTGIGRRYSQGMSSKPTVLIVDDLSLNRLMVSLALEQLGCEVIEACDGAEALSLTEHLVIDLIVMDVQMPVMDGLACSRSLRSAQRRVPILGYTTGDYRQECLDAGMDDYLAKPAPLGVLKSRLALWLGQTEAA